MDMPDKRSRIDIAFTTLFILLGVLVAADTIWVQMSFRDDVDCNTQRIEVIQDRANATAVASKSTTEAQEALVALFDQLLVKHWAEPNDPEVILARQKFFQAALDRRALAKLQDQPFPSC